MRRVKLDDGTPALIRPIRPDDADALVEGFAHLSEESRRARFLGSVACLTPDMVRYFTDVDGVDHIALVLTVEDPSQPTGERGLAVARCVRAAPGSEEAEFACTVADEWQGHHIGHQLMSALVEAAKSQGIRRFRGVMAADNARMLHIMHELGREVDRSYEPGIVSALYELH